MLITSNNKLIYSHFDDIFHVSSVNNDSLGARGYNIQCISEHTTINRIKIKHSEPC